MNDVVDKLFSIIREDQAAFEFTQVKARDGFFILDSSNREKIWLNPRLRSLLGCPRVDFDATEAASDFLEEENIEFLQNLEKGKYQITLSISRVLNFILTAKYWKLEKTIAVLIFSVLAR